MPYYTTRSAIDQDCDRRRYLGYFYKRWGIMPVGEYIPLSTGKGIHQIVGERLLGWDLDATMKGGLDTYKQSIQDHGFIGMDKEDTQYTMKEQAALIQGLTTAWDLVEKPFILDRFEVLAVEKELQVPISKDGSIILLSKPDALLRQKADGLIMTYSIKSAKRWTERLESAYKVDLQGFTEAIAGSKAGFGRVHATKFCYLIKGAWEKVKEVTMRDGMFIEKERHITKSPLIYGYKNETTKQYAHSDETIKPENKSGRGRLTPMKDWARFPIWETKGGVGRWMELLAQGRIQPELGDIIKAQVVTPVEVHRRLENMRSRLIQIQYHEARMFQSRDAVENGESIDKHFQMNSNSCYFPEPCPYLKICPNGNEDFDPAVAEDPIGSGLYVERVSHYETERKEQQKD